MSNCLRWSPARQSPSPPRNRRHCVTLFWPHRRRAKLGYFCRCSLACASGRCAVCNGAILISRPAFLTVRRTVSRIYCAPGALKSLCRRLKPRARAGKSPSRTISPRCYRKSIRGYLRRAGVRRVHPHALRHTFATTCLQSGCDIKTLSEILGHADANVTLKRYVHTDMKRKKTEMQRGLFRLYGKKRPAQTPMPA